MRPIRAVDLCCGAGGWACAARGLPVQWVAVADLAEDCLETWALNHGAAHPRCKVLRCDLSTEAGAGEVLEAAGRRVDLIVGGIPCEQVSPARGAAPLKDGELARWHDLIDRCFGLAALLRPRWWCFEDVIQVEKHLPPPLLHGLAYDCVRIDASLYGPQRRLRSFVGRFPPPAAPEPGPRAVADVLRPGPHRTVAGQARYERVQAHQGRQSGRVGGHKARILPPGLPSPCVLAARDRGSRQRRAFMVELPDGRMRQLHWQETALLQGFPEDYVFAATQGRTDSMIGRAIPVYVGRALLRAVVSEKERQTS